jgi:hypothetical protein
MGRPEPASQGRARRLPVVIAFVMIARFTYPDGTGCCSLARKNCCAGTTCALAGTTCVNGFCRYLS